MYAVLTGDIVDSSKLPDEVRRGIPAAFGRIVESLRGRGLIVAGTDVDFYRGDGWQIVLQEPREAAAAALLVRAGLRRQPLEGSSLDTRVAIGIGAVDRLDRERISRSQGAAFELSGRALDALPRGHRMGFAPLGMTAELDDALQALLALLDAIVERWTDRQAYAVFGALEGSTQSAIGESWEPEPISQQAVAQHLDAAAWGAVREALDFTRRQLGRLAQAEEPV